MTRHKYSMGTKMIPPTPRFQNIQAKRNAFLLLILTFSMVKMRQTRREIHKEVFSDG